MIHARSDYNRIQDPWAKRPVQSESEFDLSIPEDEPVFLVRGQDRIGWMVVLIYAILHYVTAQASATSVFTPPRQTALICIWHAMRMLRWAKKKNADIPHNVQDEALSNIEAAELAAQKREEGQ